jgi:hypothetical protein
VLRSFFTASILTFLEFSGHYYPCRYSSVSGGKGKGLGMVADEWVATPVLLLPS